GAEPTNHPRLDRDGGRADRALAARDVIPTGIDEEEPEMGARRDRVRHHGDQEAAVPAGLEAEAGAQIVVVLLEEAALLADGRARQVAQAARKQPHPDARGVKVDGRDDTIGPHGHLTLCVRPRSYPRPGAG